MRERNEIKPGVTLDGKYRVEAVLGEGGMGKVLLATNVHLATQVAIKILRPELSASPTSRKRFLREAQLAARLQDDHVARVYDAVDGELQPYLVMELLKGQDLATLVERRGPLPPTEAVFYVLQMLVALAEAHAVGIIHRDLKPANLFLTERSDGSPLVKVMDFGLSKDTDRDDTAASLTKSFSLLGTPLYSSPEMLSNPKRVDGRADIWAVGAILHELLSGTPTFGAPGLLEVVRRIREEQAAPLLRADVPPQLEAVIQRCLQQKLKDRYPSVVELARDLAPFGPPKSRELLVAIGRLSKRPEDVAASDTVPDPVHGPDRPAPRPADAGGERALSASPHVWPVAPSQQRPRRFLGAALAGGGLALAGIAIGVIGLQHRAVRARSAAEPPSTGVMAPVSVVASDRPTPIVTPEPSVAHVAEPALPAPPASAPVSSATATPAAVVPRGGQGAPIARPRPTAKPEASTAAQPAGTSGFGGRH